MLKPSPRTSAIRKPAARKPEARNQALRVAGLGLALCLAVPAHSQPGAATEATAVTAPAASLTTSLGIDESILDRSVKPCDDFYRFACGGWLARTQIPADRPTWSRGFSEIHERNQAVLRQILQDAAAGKGAADPTTKKLGDFYAACMAEDRIEATAKTELAALLGPIAKVGTLNDLAKEVARQHLGLGDPLFHFSSQQDFKDASRVIGSLDQGGLGLPDRDYYLKTDPKSEALRKEYLAHITRMLTLAGLPGAAAQADTIFAIEKKLAAVSLSRTDRREPKKIYHRLELDGIIKTAPKFPWTTYLGELGFPRIREINVTSPEFFAGLDKVLGEESLDNLKVYLRWHQLHGAAPSLSRAFVDENFAFYSKRLTGTDKLLPRWKRCVAATDHALGEALAVPFVQQTFGKDGKEKTLEITRNIEAAMEQNIKALSWMDEATRAQALGKLHRIANKIGSPDKPRRYDSLTVRADSYTSNLAAASAFETRRDLSKIGKPLDRSEWEMTAPTVNAYYEPPLNEIVFPAGILQPPMFGRSAHRSVNFGAIGMVMGHEVTHGFDDEGRQFDADGNLRDWWTDKVNSEFNQRAACVVDQYQGYKPIDDLHLDGKLTLGENIADLGGIKLALTSYRAAQKARPEVRPAASAFVSGLNDEQLLFLGMAQAWCEKRRPEYSRLLVTVDPHSPPEFRVNGPLSNLPDFAAAWKCEKTDKMVRQNQCTIW
jgi:endothelin-converting enzyme/putative endopeptidase